MWKWDAIILSCPTPISSLPVYLVSLGLGAFKEWVLYETVDAFSAVSYDRDHGEGIMENIDVG